MEFLPNLHTFLVPPAPSQMWLRDANQLVPKTTSAKVWASDPQILFGHGSGSMLFGFSATYSVKKSKYITVTDLFGLLCVRAPRSIYS
jgi:hypothetical protein